MTQTVGPSCSGRFQSVGLWVSTAVLCIYSAHTVNHMHTRYRFAQNSTYAGLSRTWLARVVTSAYSFLLRHISWNTGLYHFTLLLRSDVGLGSSVSIATELRAGRSGIESRRGREFPPVQTGPGAHPASCTMGTGSFPGVKCGRCVLLTTHPLLVPR